MRLRALSHSAAVDAATVLPCPTAQHMEVDGQEIPKRYKAVGDTMLAVPQPPAAVHPTATPPVGTPPAAQHMEVDGQEMPYK